MKIKTKLTFVVKATLWLFLPTLLIQLSTLFAQGTAFTYQGRLEAEGAAYTGLAEIQFSLWTADTGGSKVGSTLTVSPIGVTNGLFTVTLDFDNQFPGADRWQELVVRTKPIISEKLVTGTVEQANNFDACQ